MKYVIGAILVLLILFLLLRLDYSLGRKSHLKKLDNQDFPVRKSDLSFYTTGEELFSDLFSEIERAKDHIHVQFYIFKKDKVSHEFASLLEKKAKQGVQVRLLLDWVGSTKVTSEMEKSLKDAGVSLVYSNKPRFPYLFYKLNERNHRKITVIDGKIGYIGGYNVGKEYLGKDPEFGFWRDYHLKLTGEGVTDLQTQFLHDWAKNTQQPILNDKKYFPILSQGKSEIRLIATEGAELQGQFIDLIKQAKREITIGSPYFIPGEEIKEELIKAAKRNVHIRILLPKEADHALVKEAAFPYFKPLMDAGIEFYMYRKGFYHAKVMIIDDEVCDIGTANFDKRSMFTNYEINCYIYDKEFIQQVKNEVKINLSNSTQLTYQDLENQSTFLHGLKVKVASLLSFFL